MTWNCLCFWFCVIFCIAPFAVLVPLALGPLDNIQNTLWTIIGCVGGVGFLYLLYSLRETFIGGVCCRPEPPPQTGPLSRGAETLETVKPRRVYVIANPHGGLKKGLRILNEIALPIFQQHGVEVTVLNTEYAGHARDYAQTVNLDGYDALCVIGGDGSLHETINGLLSRPDGKKVPIGLIPGGSGNSVAQDMGCVDPRVAVQRIVAGQTVLVDANKVTDDSTLNLWSINELSWGLIGDVAVVAEECRCLGPARYDICGIWGVFKKISQKLRIVYEDANGRVELGGSYITAFVNNTQHFGKAMRAAPLAKMDDGLMDLVFLSAAPRGAMLGIFQQLPVGAHWQNKRLVFKQVPFVEFTPEQTSGVLNIDGEIVRFDGTIKVRCVQGALRVFMPPV